MRTTKYNFLGGSRAVNIRRAMSQEQLAWIGAVCLAFNDAEEWLETAFINCTKDPDLARDTVKKFGLVDLATCVFQSVKRMHFEPKIITMAEYTLIGEGFTQLKSWRDGVAHARLLDSATAVGELRQRKGIEYVLLSDAALSGLYERLSLNKRELQNLCTILSFSHSLKALSENDDQHRVQLEESIQAAIDQLDQLQQMRRSLPPLPKFPQADQQFRVASHKAEPGNHGP